VSWLASSPDDRTLVAISTISNDRNLARIIAAADGEVLATQELKGKIYQISFSPDSQHVAFGLERQIRLVDFTPGAPPRSIDCASRPHEGCPFGMLRGKELVTVRDEEVGSMVVRIDWESDQAL